MLDNKCSTLKKPRLLLHPPAKINISLVVFGLRDDGYHDLHSVMATVDLTDDLYLSPAQAVGIHLSCSGLPCPDGRENLVYRAAELLARRAGLEPSLAIRLNKRIPAGAGLGGGSSDAAACLLGLNRLWKLDFSRAELSPLAAQLGSDVPFFLYAPVAVCTGRGEVVQPIPHRCRRAILLILPDIHVPTPQVYQHYIHDQDAAGRQMVQVNDFLARGDLDGLLTHGINSLMQPCLQLFEPLRCLRDRILSLGIAPVCVSGSGSAFFVPATSPAQAASWACQLQKQRLVEATMLSFQDHAPYFPEVHHADF